MKLSQTFATSWGQALVNAFGPFRRSRIVPRETGPCDPDEREARRIGDDLKARVRASREGGA